jgi:hypothetical protein
MRVGKQTSSDWRYGKVSTIGAGVRKGLGGRNLTAHSSCAIHKTQYLEALMGKLRVLPRNDARIFSDATSSNSICAVALGSTPWSVPKVTAPIEPETTRVGELGEHQNEQRIRPNANRQTAP